MANSPLQGSRHSQASASPGTSQVASDIAIDTLVSHLLASKRSLSSISTVWRANEIVTSARSALEETIIVHSRTAFLRRGISQQAKILRKIRTGVDHVYRDGHRDFQEVIRTLDSADIRLQKTMDVLRSTIVEAAFRPPDEEPRSLLDFVDEAGVEAMRTALKESIDHTQDAQAEFLDSIQSFDRDIKAMKAAMTAETAINEASSVTLPTPIPPLLHTLEDNAAEMAQLLESLIKHFDLCVNAIKHTEGGFAAVKQAATDNKLPDGVTVSGVIQEEGPGDSSLLEPLNDVDRLEMLNVLSTDAAEVEDVVLELHQRLASMEEAFEQIQERVSGLTSTFTTTISAFTTLEAIGSRLPVYIASSQDFLLRWGDAKAQIIEQMEELESMRVFYEGYMSSYHGLIDEVHRRRASEEKMRGIMKKATEQVRKLHDVESRERDAFRRNVGDYLPSDLWPGLVSDAPRWQISASEAEGEKERVPDEESILRHMSQSTIVGDSGNGKVQSKGKGNEKLRH